MQDPGGSSEDGFESEMARGKSLLPGWFVFILRCKEKEVMLVSALIEDP